MSFQDEQTTETLVPTGVPAVPQHHNRKWTDAERDVLKDLWSVGVSARKIGERLGKTKNAIIGQAHRLKLATPAHRRTPVNPQAINSARKRSDGHTCSPKFAAAPVPDINAAGDVARVSLDDLTDCSCRWPVGDPQKSGFGFCGCKPVPGLPYCEHHAQRAFVPVELKPRKLPKPIPWRQTSVSMLAVEFDD